MDLIYCAGGNTKLASIAINEGFLYGARSDDIRRLRCNGMIDINWKNYNWLAFIEKVKLHKPKYAVIPDILNYKDVSRSIRLAQQVIECGSIPIIVPKVHKLVRGIPNKTIIGVSVPSSYAGFLPNVLELKGRRVHLLGGSPKKQYDLWHYYELMGVTVISADINCHNKASDFGAYWNGYSWRKDKKKIGKYEAFKKSCQGIMKMWHTAGIEINDENYEAV